MFESNINRNICSGQCQPTSQRTLIYDLRSELSNLKNQFSKLIKKPIDIIPKSKNESHSINRQKLPNNSNSTQYQFPNQGSNSIDKYDHYNNDKNISTGIQKWSNIKYIKNTNTNQYFNNTNYTNGNQLQINTNQNKFYQSNCPTPLKIKKQQSSNSHKKYMQVVSQKDTKTPQKNHKITQINNQLNIIKNQYLNNLQEKLKKIQSQKKIQYQPKQEQIKKNNVSNNTKLQHKQQQQDLKQRYVTKNQKIQKLQLIVNQLTHNLIIANQNIKQLQKNKNQQIHKMKQEHTNQIKNQNIFNQAKINTLKSTTQLKHEQQLKAHKQQSNKKFQAIQKQRQLLLKKNQQLTAKINELTNKLSCSSKQKQILQNSLLIIKDTSLKQSEQIKKLVTKQNLMELQIKQRQQWKDKDKIFKQFGINCDLKVLDTSNYNQTSLELQNKQMQEKISLYLNNIQKQTHKMKQQKNDLQKTQKTVEEKNRIISEREGEIRNIMNDFKNMEKQLEETRKIMSYFEFLLDQSNQQISKLQSEKLNRKYHKKKL